MRLVRFLRRRFQRELAITTDRHFPPAPKSPPPPPPPPPPRRPDGVRRDWPRTVAEMTDRELLEEIYEAIDRVAYPGKYWRGGPR